MSGDLELKEKIENYNLAYQLGEPLVNDEVYDQMLEYAELMGVKVSTTAGIGNERDVKLPINMASMNKANTPEVFKRWKAKYPGPYVVSAKMDGISCLIDKNKAYTRGDDGTGQEITWIKNLVDIPDSPEDYLVRGELIISKAMWDSIKNDVPYKNPLSFVSGMSNRRESANDEDKKSLAKKLSFVSFQLISRDSNEQKIITEQYKLLRDYGYKIPTFARVSALDWISDDKNNCKEVLDIIRGKSSFYLDGIIITNDKKYERVDGVNPVYAIAYKDSVVVTSKVKSVEWKVSKESKLVPIVVFEKTEVDGKTYEKVTGHNLAFIKKFSIGPGSIITIGIKSVPNIIGVTNNTDIAPSLPTSDWYEEGVDAISRDADNQKDIVLKQISFFFKKIGTKGIDVGIISKFYDNDLKTILDILRATVETWSEIIGVNNGPKLRNKAYEAINKASIESIMAGSSFFPNVGETIFVSITNVIGYGGIMNSNLMDYKDKLEGVAEGRINKIEGAKESFRIWFEELKSITNYEIPTSNSTTSNALILVEMTGTPLGMNKKEFAAKYGFKLVSLAKASMLITDDMNSVTGKMNIATEKGIPIKTYTQIVREKEGN